MRPTRVVRLTFLVLTLLLVPACRDDVASTSEPEPTTLPPPSTAGPTPSGSGDIVGFPLDTILFNDTELLVALADDPGRRSQGLRQVEDFGEVDGMLFVFGGPVNAVFTMQDTPTPLDLLLLEEDGTVLEILHMDPCGGADCRYPPTVVYHYALEVPQGSLDVAVGDRLVIP